MGLMRPAALSGCGPVLPSTPVTFLPSSRHSATLWRLQWNFERNQDSAMGNEQAKAIG
jgi:hypothetical protein